MTLEEEKRYLLLLSSYYLMNKYSNDKIISKREVLDTINDLGWVYLNNNDLKVKDNRNELVWRNDFAFIRKHLVEENFYYGNIKNNWKITSEGKSELERLHNICKLTNRFKKITNNAIIACDELLLKDL